MKTTDSQQPAMSFPGPSELPDGAGRKLTTCFGLVMKMTGGSGSSRCLRVGLLVAGGCLLATLAWSIPFGGGTGGDPKSPQSTLKVEGGHAYVGVGPVDPALSYTVEESEDLGTWVPGKLAGDETTPPPVPPLEAVREARRTAADGSPFGIVPVERAEESKRGFYRVRVGDP